MKKVLITIVVIIVIAVAAGIVIWNKPPRKAENTKGIAITAQQLSKQYNTNETAANAKYLNKALAVSGNVAKIDTNQSGVVLVYLKVDSSTALIQCAMREKKLKNVGVSVGQAMVIKGFCSGALMSDDPTVSDVDLTDCVYESK